MQDSSTSAVPVRYTFVITNKVEMPLDSVKISLTDENLTESVLYSGTDGRATTLSMESQVNQISMSKPGFVSKDSVDYVPQPADSLGVKVILRIIRVRLDSLVRNDSIH